MSATAAPAAVLAQRSPVSWDGSYVITVAGSVAGTTSKVRVDPIVGSFTCECTAAKKFGRPCRHVAGVKAAALEAYRAQAAA